MGPRYEYLFDLKEAPISLPGTVVSVAVYIGKLCSSRHRIHSYIDAAIFTQFFLSLTIPRIHYQHRGYPKSPKTIGQHIRKRRMDLRLLQRDVAGIIGVTECTVFGWEKGMREPSTKHVPRIIDFLGYSPFEGPGDIFEY